MLEKVEKLANSAGDQRMVARCHKTFGNLCILSKRNAISALQYYQQAYHYFITAKDQHWHGVLCHDLADAYLMTGNPVKAYQFIEEGLKVVRGLGDKRLEQALQEIIDAHPALTTGLSERQCNIVWEVMQVGEIRTKRCVELTGLSRSQAMKILQELERLQILQKVGKGRGTRYILRSA